MRHTLADLEQIWTANGGNPVYAPVAAAFSLAETGGSGDDQAVSPANSDGSRDWGLWQINNGGQALLDPNANARAAIAKSNNGQNWQYWTTAYAGGPGGVINGGGYTGSGNKNYLAKGAAFWQYLPTGATLPPGAGTTGGIAGTPGSSAPGGATAPAAGSTTPTGCVFKLPKADLGPLGSLGGWCVDTPVGLAVMVAGVGVMLIGTVVVLSRFSGTRQIATTALSAVPGGGAVAMGARAAGANVGAPRARSRPSPSRSSRSSSSSERESLSDEDLQALDANLGASRPDRAASRQRAQRENRARRRARGPARPRGTPPPSMRGSDDF